MPTTCFDNRIWDDLRYKALPPALRAALGPMISRLQQYGDGCLTDRELRIDLLGPKRMDQLVSALISWGWLSRAQNGNLARAGLLVPLSADALRMRALRTQQSSEAAPSTQSTASTPEQPANTTRTETEQPANATFVLARPAASESDQNQIRSEPHIHVESDPIRLTSTEDPSPPGERAAPPSQCTGELFPKNKAFDRLLVEGVDSRVLAEAARRMASHRPPIEPWKERYLRATVKSIIAERQQSFAMVTAVPGGAPPNRASPPAQPPNAKPAFLTRRFANGGTIL